MPQGTVDLKAVIFDFDGVLVDSEPLHYQAFCDVLTPMGLAHSYDVYLERYIGFDDRDALRAIFQDAGRPLTPELFEHLLQAKEAAFQRIVSHGVVPFAGARELVKELYEARLPLAIASGAKTTEICLILRTLNLLEAFSVIVSADDVQAGKPHPETYQRAVEALYAAHPALGHDATSNGASPRGVVVVEDTPAGIQAARAAGLFVVAVAHTYPAGELHQAQWTVPRLSDLSLDRLRHVLKTHAPSPLS
ncbi:HAD family hydrolase [Desulfosoma caldarium]|uniref:HAD superfamily hydrolase (TIGR01509 family) n=1 Tax=Desulfosoma caldarium TaxID=610254 RepID=A0A3N1UPS1_9BACT|nr:HAD family phosphatase [Desulfosoma caldarium]ROQ89891.1 HAD superfamily hydrolase (TIGR01509 family) [Desulfosoma caldarium]